VRATTLLILEPSPLHASAAYCLFAFRLPPSLTGPSLSRPFNTQSKSTLRCSPYKHRYDPNLHILHPAQPHLSRNLNGQCRVTAAQTRWSPSESGPDACCSRSTRNTPLGYPRAVAHGMSDRWALSDLLPAPKSTGGALSALAVQGGQKSLLNMLPFIQPQGRWANTSPQPRVSVAGAIFRPFQPAFAFEGSPSPLSPAPHPPPDRGPTREGESGSCG